MGGIRISLPVFPRTGTSRQRYRSCAELVPIAAGAPENSHRSRRRPNLSTRLQADRSLETGAGDLNDSDSLATRGFEAGQISLADLLLSVEILDTRFQYLTWP
jgi:hypothetical protein